MNMNVMKKLLLLLLLSVVSPVFSAQIGVSFDRNPVNLEESFQIIFTADDTPDNDPDFAPLEQDFEILGQSQSSNSSWVNGQSSKTIQWTLNVMAKHPGSLVVPEVKFGKDASSPASILVTQTTANSANKAVDSDDDLFLEVEATPENPYVQSQVLYTIRLYRRVEIAQAALNEPELGDAVIEKLGDDSNYNTQINGVNYLVTQRRYAIFPQKSGSVTIKPVLLTAEVAVNSRPNFNGFFNQRATKTKKITSKSVTLEVKPAPANFGGQHWLSAEQLVLKEEWSSDNQQMKVGEPMTRTLTLEAKGTTVGQLPELNTGKIEEQLKTYPDQPVLREQKKSEGVNAFREEKIAIIPSKAGSYKLPVIEIPWFNTQTKKVEIARVPEATIIAKDAAGAEVATPVANTPVPLEPESKTLEPQITPQQQTNIWLWATLFLALGWLITVLYFLKIRSSKKLAPEKNESEVRLQDCVKILKQACADNDPIAAKDALLAWGQLKFVGMSLQNIGAIAELSDARLRDEIRSLNQALYSDASVEWQGKKLFQVFIENKARDIKTVQVDDKLEPLNQL